MIVDTNALSGFADGNPKIRELLASGSGPFLPVMVLGEYRFGLLGSREREKRLGWLRNLAEKWPVLEVTAETAEHYAAIRHGLRQRATPIPSNDSWIAALALQHESPILSDDQHFDLVSGVARVGF
jgi:tRNA(fMet)-specific endonuclease VapC